MDNIKVTVFGKDHETRNEIFVRSFDAAKIAVGTSVGTTSKPHEDAIGVSVWGLDSVLAIADGHWGKDAGELAIIKSVELLQSNARPSKDSETRARLFALVEQVNVELFDRAMSEPGAPASETTLIVCHVKQTALGKYLYWSSIGDSYLFLLRNGEMKQLNSLNSYWLGFLSKLSENSNSKSILMRFLSEEARYVGVASGLETGIEQLESGDFVVLCTDGLLGSDSQPDPSVVEGMKAILVSDLPLESKVEKMIEAALAEGKRIIFPVYLRILTSTD